MSKKKKLSNHAVKVLEEVLMPPEMHLPEGRKLPHDKGYVKGWNECLEAVRARFAELQNQLH